MASGGVAALIRAVRLPLLLAAILLAVGPAGARVRRPDKPVAAAPPPLPTPPIAPAAPSDSRPYDPQLMRLSEVLGALTTMRTLCGAPDADQWRRKMEALLESEGTPQVRRDRLAGAYNRGLKGYGLVYRTCTPNARLVIQRFLDESGRLAREIGNRYRAS